MILIKSLEIPGPANNGMTVACLHKEISRCNIRKFRNLFSKFRSRHSKRPKHEWICRLCNNGIEDEIYSMFYCPVYDTVRQKYIPRKYYMLPNFNKFYILMSCVRIILLFVCCILCYGMVALIRINYLHLYMYKMSILTDIWLRLQCFKSNITQNLMKMQLLGN